MRLIGVVVVLSGCGSDGASALDAPVGDVDAELGDLDAGIDGPSIDAPPPMGVVFHSDFSTALGTTDAALRDTSKTTPWTIVGGNGLEVIAATGLDFPTANVLRVTATAQTTGWSLVRKTGIQVPANGQSLWYRVYARYTFPDGLEDNQTHPIQDGNAGSQINWEWSIFHNEGGAGRFRPSLAVHSSNPFNDYTWHPPTLEKNVTYRFEWQVARLTDTTFELHARIYDAGGTLLYDDDDFVNNNQTKTLGSTPTPTLLFNNPANLDGLNGGCNGISGTAPPFPFVYGYQGAFAVSDQGWIGPYAGGI